MNTVIRIHVSEEVRSDHDGPKEWSEEEFFLGEQSRGQKVRSAIKSNVLNHSTDENKYQEGTRQRESL